MSARPSSNPNAHPGTNPSARTLVLCDGDLPGFYAAWAARERAIADGPSAAMPIMAPFHAGASVAEPIEHAVGLQARALGLTAVASVSAHATQAEDLPGHAEAMALINACYAAVRLNCDRVVFPAHACVGESLDLDRVAAIADRAVLVARLCALDALAHHTPGIRVETPYADLTDVQLADLFLDADLSPRALWWWGASTDAARTEQGRWMRSLEPMGFKA